MNTDTKQPSGMGRKPSAIWETEREKGIKKKNR